MNTTFSEYEKERLAAQGTPRPKHDGLASGALGLTGEAGEFAELVKKHLFHGIPLDKDACIKELGDVLWYVMYCAQYVGSSLEEVAQKNNEKLRARYPNGWELGGGKR